MLNLMITKVCDDIIEGWSTLNPHLSDHSAIHSKLSLARPNPLKVKKQYKICGVDLIEFCNYVMASSIFPHLHPMGMIYVNSMIVN